MNYSASSSPPWPPSSRSATTSWARTCSCATSSRSRPALARGHTSRPGIDSSGWSFDSSTRPGGGISSALKILDNPQLAEVRPASANAFKTLSAKATHKPTAIDCAVVANRDEAAHWLTLRHTGENQGAGVVPWSAEQTQGFSGRSGSHAYAAVNFADAIEAAYAGNKDILADLATVRSERLTTLGRLIQDPDVRKALGMVLEKEGVRFHYPTAALEPAFRKMLGDLASKLTVSALKSKEQRRTYLDSLPQPDPKTYALHPTPLKRAPATATAAAKRKASTTATKYLLVGVSVGKFSTRIQSIVSELRRLDVNNFPNSCGVLLRVVVELAVDDFLAARKLKLSQELKDKIRKALTTIDPTYKDDAYAAIRAGLADGTSLMAAKTMHSFVHNPHYHPTPTELRSIAANYGPFVEALDSALP